MDLFHRLLLLLPQFFFEKITVKNYMQYFCIFTSNKQYWELTQGSPATEQDCLETMDYCPQNCNKEQVYCLGVREDEKPIAIISLLENYPRIGVLYIGLLQIDGYSQHKGIGSIIMSAIFKASNGLFDSIQLSVQKNNTGAVRFWEKQSFIIDIKTMSKDTENLPLKRTIA